MLSFPYPFPVSFLWQLRGVVSLEGFSSILLGFLTAQQTGFNFVVILKHFPYFSVTLKQVEESSSDLPGQFILGLSLSKQNFSVFEEVKT